MSAATADRIAVVIPALNEERAIRGVVESVLALCPNVIVIDDGSTDHTIERIADLPVTVIRHATPLGKGQGLRDGFRKARELGFDAVVAMDGDGQHLAADIPRLLAAAAHHPQHIVIGARIRNRDNQPPARRRANAVADWGISWGCALPVADTQSGQRYYPLGALELADLAADDFVFEAALLIAATREKGLGVVSVPIDSRYEGEFRGSHFRPVRDVTRITVYTVKRILHYGRVIDSYRRGRGRPPLVYDPPE
jgi:glycosyltransferase involved in cell wall biosynthesis